MKTILEYAESNRQDYQALLESGKLNNDNVNRGIIIGKYNAMVELMKWIKGQNK